MKFFAIFAAAALAFAPALFSAEAVKIDGKYYMEDAGGNLIRLPEGAVPEAPKRRPARSGNTVFRIRRRGIPSGGRKRRRSRRFRPRAPAKRRRSIQPALLRRRRGRIALRMSVPSSKSAAERGRFCTGSDSRFRSRRRLRSAERSRRAVKPRWFSKFRGLKTN